MPNRILKESICTSEDLNALTDKEEVFFYRLIVNCDDFGIMDAREPILRAKCFPLKIDTVKDEDIKQWLCSLERQGLVYLYIADGRPYLKMVSWEKHQQVRAKRSKYPQPDMDNMKRITNDIKCNQVQSNVPENPIQSESNPNPNNTYVATDVAEYENDVSNTISAEKSSGSEDAIEDEGAQHKKVGKDEYTQEFKQFWSSYPRKIEKRKAFRAWKARMKEKIPSKDMIQASQNYADACKKLKTEQRYIKHASTFLGPDKPYEEYIKGLPEKIGSTNKSVLPQANFDQREYTNEDYKNFFDNT